MITLLLVDAALAAPRARALLVDGDVHVVRAGEEPVELRRGDEIDEADTIDTRDEGSVILQLDNDHLVRLDSEVQLPVNALAMLGAPKATASTKAQLDMLLDPEERDDYGGMVAATESVGGWRAQLAAASTRRSGRSGSVTALEEREKQIAPETSVPQPRPAPPPRSRRAVDLSRNFEGAGEGARSGGGNGAGPGAGFGVASGPPAQPAKPSQAVPGDLAPLLAKFAPGAVDYQTCIMPWLQQTDVLSIRSEIVIAFEVSDGTIERVWEQEHIPLPRCLRQALVGKPVSDEHPARLELR